MAHTEYVRLGRLWALFFVEHPVLLTPTWTQPPFPHGFDLGDEATDRITGILRYITPPNLLGLPSVAVPVGVADGLPQGVQCISDRWRDDLALAAAADIEAALGTITPIDPVTG